MSAVSEPKSETPLREYELKFPFPQARTPALLQWLRCYCVPHPQFHETVISSVYYDTPLWKLLNEKINSDYFKAKVRVRWYNEGGHRAWLEAKLKEGSQRLKIRRQLAACGSELAETRLDSARFEHLLMPLYEEGFSPGMQLRPVYQITYRRLRFLHRFSPSIFCLDHEITVPRVNPSCFRHNRPGALARAVLEQKGPLDDLDPVLGASRYFRLQKQAFSKYMDAYFHLRGDPH